MYVCTTNGSCPPSKVVREMAIKHSKVGLIKCYQIMNEKQENRSQWIKIRLKPTEQTLLEQRYKQTTFHCLSEYARTLLFGKPITVLNRDRSMDEVLEELMLLRRELNAIGNNLNQAVRNINSAHGFPDPGLWVNLLKIINGELEPSINEIKERINQYAEVWSQKLKAVKA